MNYRIRIETVEESEERWGWTWAYECGPCRGGPCGVGGYEPSETEALEAAINNLRDTILAAREP